MTALLFLSVEQLFNVKNIVIYQAYYRLQSQTTFNLVTWFEPCPKKGLIPIPQSMLAFPCSAPLSYNQLPNLMSYLRQILQIFESFLSVTKVVQTTQDFLVSHSSLIFAHPMWIFV